MSAYMKPGGAPKDAARLPALRYPPPYVQPFFALSEANRERALPLSASYARVNGRPAVTVTMGFDQQRHLSFKDFRQLVAWGNEVVAMVDTWHFEETAT